MHGGFIPKARLLKEHSAPRRPLGEPLALDSVDGEVGWKKWDVVHFVPLVINISYLFGKLLSPGTAK